MCDRNKPERHPAKMIPGSGILSGCRALLCRKEPRRHAAGALLLLLCAWALLFPVLTVKQPEKAFFDRQTESMTVERQQTEDGGEERIPGKKTSDRSAAGTYSKAADTGGTVSVNHGDVEELCELPGVGESIAAAIITEREENGPFRYPEDLLNVRGIGPAKLAGFLSLLDLSE